MEARREEQGLERCLHGEFQARHEGSGVGAKGKNRKENGNGAKPEAVRPEPEQAKDDGMSDEIVREFLVESSTKLEPAGK